MEYTQDMKNDIRINDTYKEIASQIFNVPIEKVTKEQRKFAKHLGLMMYQVKDINSQVHYGE